MDPQKLAALESAISTFNNDLNTQSGNVTQAAKAQQNADAAVAQAKTASQAVTTQAAQLQTDLDNINSTAAALGLTVNVPSPGTTAPPDSTTTTPDPNASSTTLAPLLL